MADFNGLRGALPNAITPLSTQPPVGTITPLSTAPAVDVGTPAVDETAGQFARGLRQGILGTTANLRAAAANIGEALGAPEYAKSQLAEIDNIKRSMSVLRPEVQNASDIHGVSDALKFATSAAGQATPTIATAMGGAALGGLGAKALGLRLTPAASEFVGGAMGVFPQEMGESALQMYNSPEAMQRSAAERLAIASGKGAVSAALESLVPASIVGKVAHEALPLAARGLSGAAKYVGGQALKAGVEESLTEGAQSIAGQMALHYAAPNSEALMPTGDELATSMLGGFFPGKAMGAAGALGQLARGRIEGALKPDAPDLGGLIDAARNPQLNQFISSMRPPQEVVQGGRDAVAQWINDSGRMDEVRAKAQQIAADESLPAAMRQRAEVFARTGDPELLRQFTGMATAHQAGLDAAESARRLGSDAMRILFGMAPTAPTNPAAPQGQTGTKFNAQAVPLTEADAPLVSALSPYLRHSDEQAVASAVPIIRDYLVASQSNPNAAMPVNMLSLFGPNKSQEGLRAAVSMMQRMGVLDDVSGQQAESMVTDALQRQKAWQNLITTNLAPQHGQLRTGEINKLAGVLESLAADATAQPGETDKFMQAAQLAFGVNTPRALERMQALLPQAAGNMLGGAVSSVGDLAEPLQTGAARDAGEAVAAPTAAENLSALGMTEQAAPAAEAQWSFANNQLQQPYDTTNPEQMANLASNAQRLTRSGFSEAVPTGVVDYAKLTGDMKALEQARLTMPGAPDMELNRRFQVLGVHKTGNPEAEQVTYDELLGKKSPWRSEFGAIKLFEPGKKAATLVTTPGQIIKQMRAKEQVVNEDMTGPEANMSDFSRAVAALMNVQKNGQPAFDRMEVMDQSGKYVPLSELPDNFSLFQGVTVGDAKKALSTRMRTEGVGPNPSQMSFADMKSAFQRAVADYKAAQASKDSAGMKSARERADELVAELRTRLTSDLKDNVRYWENALEEAEMSGDTTAEAKATIELKEAKKRLFAYYGDKGTDSLKRILMGTSELPRNTVGLVQAPRKEAQPRTWSKGSLSEMGLADLRAEYSVASEKAQKAVNKKAREALEKKVRRIEDEVQGRLVRDGMDASDESVSAALTEGSISPTMLRPSEDVSVSATTTPLTSTSLTSRFKTLEAAQQFVDEIGGRGDITKRGDFYTVSNYASVPARGAADTALESEEFADGARPNIPESEMTPGDLEAAREGERLFQEETGELLHPAQHRSADSTRNQIIASARRLAEAVSKAANSSIKRTILKELSAATADDVPEVAMRGIIKAAERSALLNGLISPDQAQFMHGGLMDKLNKRSTERDRQEALDQLRWNSQLPSLAVAMSEEQKAAVREWIARVLPKAVVQFVNDLGGMSGSYDRDALGNALIRINVFATDPLGVAYHEGVHDLFATLKEAGHQPTIDLLQRVASSSIMQRKLSKLLEGNAAAQAQLKDPEEAAAYMFQFWNKGLLELGPQSETFFQKIVNAVKWLMGQFDDVNQAAQVFSAFNSGHLKEPAIRDKVLESIQTNGASQLTKMIKPLTDKVGKLTDTVDSRFRDSGNPYLVKIIDKFNNDVNGTSKELGFFAAVAQSRNRLLNKLGETLKNTNPDVLRAAVDELQQQTKPGSIADPEVRKVVEDVRDTLEKLYKYMDRKGVLNTEGKPLGYLRDYFPRVWSIDKLVSDGDKFVADLIKHHSKELAAMAPKGVSVDDVARSILNGILSNSGTVDEATATPLTEEQRLLGYTPAMNAANIRLLKFLDPKVFSQYEQKDLVATMTQYIHQAAKRAEYSERFGSNGDGLSQLMEDAINYDIDKRMSEKYGREYLTLKQRGADNAAMEARFPGQAQERGKIEVQAVKDFQTYRAGVQALEGTLGHDITPGLRKLNSTLMTYQNIRVLPLAVLSSFIDPLGIMVRGGEMKHAYKAFTRGVKEVIKGWKGEQSGAEDADVALAELMGTLEPSSYLDSLGQTYGSMYMTGGARRANDILFRINGMEGWNRAMRTQATLAAMDFIKGLKEKPGPHTERYLKELGLTANDIVIKKDGSLDLTSKDKRLQFAIMRWVDGAVLRPNAAQRPAWASNPKFALLFHLNQYTYSFQKVILERMYSEAKHGNYDPAMVAVAGYIPVMLAANIVRAFIQGGGEEPDWMKGQDSLVDWVKRAVQGAGLLGVSGMISEKFPTGLAGPTVQQAADAVFKDKDITDTMEKALPLQVIYRHW